MTGSVTKRIIRQWRIIHPHAFSDWLESRIRRLGDCCALNVWLAATAGLLAAWIPALCGMPV